MTKSNQNFSTEIMSVALMIVVWLTFFSLFMFTKTEMVSAQTMCTMDAMQCPDGSWVGRSGPSCEFVCQGQSGGGSPGYDGNTSSKPTYPTTPAPTGTGPDTPVSDSDLIPPTSSGQVGTSQPGIEPGMAEDADASIEEEQVGWTGYLKNLLGSIAFAIAGLFGWM